MIEMQQAGGPVPHIKPSPDSQMTQVQVLFQQYTNIKPELQSSELPIARDMDASNLNRLQTGTMVGLIMAS